MSLIDLNFVVLDMFMQHYLQLCFFHRSYKWVWCWWIGNINDIIINIIDVEEKDIRPVKISTNLIMKNAEINQSEIIAIIWLLMK